MSDIKKFLFGTYNTFINLVYGKSTTNKNTVETIFDKKEDDMYSYIPIYATTNNVSISLENYFSGKCNGRLLEKITHTSPSKKQSIPLFSNLYDASYYLWFLDGAWKREARYILVVNKPKDEVLTLLEEGKLHKQVIGAINYKDLISFISNKNLDPLSSEAYEKFNLFDNENIEYIKNELASQVTNKSEPNCLIL